MKAIHQRLSARVRPQFPALQRTIDGKPVAYFDGPGGTQVPRGVADAVSDYLLFHNANDGWEYATSRETVAFVADAREKLSAFLNAASPGEILFGANMTTLTFHLARAIGRTLRPGDEIVVTELDHHANIDPWVALARDYGAVIRNVPLANASPELDFAAFERLLGPRTRLVALGLSSNAFGTRNPVARYAAAAHAHGALVFVDAVHAAAHGPLDVAALQADMLAFSAYKVYGPHVGIAYCRDDLLERLDVPRLAPQTKLGAKRAETGTLNFEGIAGTAAALDFIESLSSSTHASRRGRYVDAMQSLAREEHVVFRALADGLRALPGVRIYEPSADCPRHPTIAFTVAGRAADDVAAELGSKAAVFLSHGNFYAATAVAKVAPESLARGGVLRAGVAAYTTQDEVERLLAAVAGVRA